MVNDVVFKTTQRALAKGKLVALVGGDHSTPYGAIRAHAEAFRGMGVLHVDAHADLREAFEGFTHSHASIMFNVMKDLPSITRLVQVGLRDVSEDEVSLIARSGGRIVAHFDAELGCAADGGEPWGKTIERIVGDLPTDVYVSFDVDGLDPALCPHTGTPVPGGLSFHQACALIAAVARSGRRIVGLDLNEVAPAPGGADEWDGNVGARLLYKMIGWMLVSQGRITPPRRPRA
jgi:agmatinase